MSLIVFIFITLALFMVPLVPALVELIKPTDIEPLKIVRGYDTNIKFFAHGFKQYLESQLGKEFEQTLSHIPAEPSGTLENGAAYEVIRHNDIDEFQTIQGNKELVLASTPIILSAGETFECEIYGTENIIAQEHTTIRAILAEKELHFQDDCMLLRWTHSNGLLTVGQNSKLYGRASSDTEIQLMAGCEFSRVYAPYVWFGSTTTAPVMNINPDTLLPLEKPSNIMFESESRWVIDDDITIPDNSYFEGDIIASRNITIGNGAYIKGSVKANGHLALGESVVIEGSAISESNIITNSHCHIGGPFIAEEKGIIGPHNVIGRESSETTVTGNYIDILTGTLVHGSIWTLEGARVIQANAVEAPQTIQPQQGVLI